MIDDDDGTSVGRLLRAAVERLGGDPDARVDAQVLLAFALQRDRGWLIAHHGDLLPAPTRQAFGRLVDRRAAGHPVAYLTGRRGFRNLDLEVEPGVLIPRPETEQLVDLALDLIPAANAARIADLGTGSGAIALALASERPLAWVVAVDASAQALRIAAANARRLGLRNVAFAQCNWLDAFQGADTFDLIATNPPYLAEADEHLSRGDLRFEPRMALASGADGLDAIRSIVQGAGGRLRPAGHLLVEHGATQAGEVRGLLQGAGFLGVQTWTDLAGHERVSGGSSAG